ncbi:hypothetical protein [Aporhodopirellula aestuarii]|nr:hypothetical protein [Aporhodopirellula aestuarii]
MHSGIDRQSDTSPALPADITTTASLNESTLDLFVADQDSEMFER